MNREITHIFAIILAAALLSLVPMKTGLAQNQTTMAGMNQSSVFLPMLQLNKNMTYDEFAKQVDLMMTHVKQLMNTTDPAKNAALSELNNYVDRVLTEAKTASSALPSSQGLLLEILFGIGAVITAFCFVLC